MKEVKLTLAVSCKDLAILCREANGIKKAGEISCPIDEGPLCGVFFCPFKGRCSTVTAADWKSITKEAS